MMKSKKSCIILFALILLLLVTGVKIVGLLTEKIRANPIPEQTQAIVFLPTAEEGTCRVIDDEKTITRLCRAYRWTNGHMFCCMEKPQAYLDVVVVGAADGRERSEYHENLLVDSYNIVFRFLLHQAKKETKEYAIAYFDMTDSSDLAAAKAAFPEYLLYTRDTGHKKLCVVSAQPLTAEEKEQLQSILQ